MIDSFLPFDDEPEPTPALVPAAAPPPVPITALAPIVSEPEVLPAIRAERVPGVTIRYEPHRKKPWVVFVDTRVGSKRVNGAKSCATEAEAEARYPFAAADLLRRQQEHADKQRLTAALNVPPLPQAPKGTTLFETLALRWMHEYVRVMLTAATYDSYQGGLNHLLPIMRTWPMHFETLTGQRIKHVLKVELAKTKVNLPTRLACQSTLSAFFTWAKGELPPGYLPDNPAKGIGRFVRNEDEIGIKLDPPPNPMTRVQAEDFLVWIKAHAPRPIYELFVWLIDEGSRSGEVSALKWANLELVEGKGKAHIVDAFSQNLRRREIQKGIDRGVLRGEKDTKTHRQDQFIDLSDRVVEVYTRLKADNREAWLKRGRRPITEPVHCLLTRRLTPLRVSDKSVQRWFHKGIKALELVGQTGDPFTIHCLRDTFATLALLEGQDLGWVAQQLGHEDPETTRKHYVKWVRLVEANPLAKAKGQKK